MLKNTGSLHLPMELPRKLIGIKLWRGNVANDILLCTVSLFLELIGKLIFLMTLNTHSQQEVPSLSSILYLLTSKLKYSCTNH